MLIVRERAQEYLVLAHYCICFTPGVVSYMLAGKRPLISSEVSNMRLIVQAPIESNTSNESRDIFFERS